MKCCIDSLSSTNLAYQGLQRENGQFGRTVSAAVGMENWDASKKKCSEIPERRFSGHNELSDGRGDGSIEQRKDLTRGCTER